MCACDSDEVRQAALRDEFNAWPDGTHQNTTDTLVAALSYKVQNVQQGALAAHSRGEDTSASEQELWKMVDLLVQIKVLMRDLKLQTEGPPEQQMPQPGTSSRPKETRIQFDS